MSRVFVLFSLCCWCFIGVFSESVLVSVSVTEGDSVTLHTDTEIREDEDILWKLRDESSLIAEISKAAGIFSTFNGTDERFRDRLKLDTQTGSLTITNITTLHTGLYEVKRSGAKLSSKIFSVSVYSRLPVPVIISNSSNCPSSSSSSSSSSSQQNCSLLCSVVNVGHVTLSWFKGNSVLSSISVSDLSISLSLSLEVEYQENNTYSCVLNNPIRNHTTHLDISRLCHTCAGPPEGSVSLTVLISAAAAFMLIFAAVGIFGICRKHRKTDREVQTREDEITYAEPMFYKKHYKSKSEDEDNVVYTPVATRR